MYRQILKIAAPLLSPQKQAQGPVRMWVFRWGIRNLSQMHSSIYGLEGVYKNTLELGKFLTYGDVFLQLPLNRVFVTDLVCPIHKPCIPINPQTCFGGEAMRAHQTSVRHGTGSSCIYLHKPPTPHSGPLADTSRLPCHLIVRFLSL